MFLRRSNNSGLRPSFRYLTSCLTAVTPIFPHGLRFVRVVDLSVSPSSLGDVVGGRDTHILSSNGIRGRVVETLSISIVDLNRGVGMVFSSPSPSIAAVNVVVVVVVVVVESVLDVSSLAESTSDSINVTAGGALI